MFAIIRALICREVMHTSAYYRLTTSNDFVVFILRDDYVELRRSVVWEFEVELVLAKVLHSWYGFFQSSLVLSEGGTGRILRQAG